MINIFKFEIHFLIFEYNLTISLTYLSIILKRNVMPLCMFILIFNKLNNI